VRDHNGTLIRAQALWYDSAANATLMEAFALRHGVRLAVGRGYQKVIMESDSKVAINLCADDHSRSELMPICQRLGN
jgi:hypothetical protein